MRGCGVEVSDLEAQQAERMSKADRMSKAFTAWKDKMSKASKTLDVGRDVDWV